MSYQCPGCFTRDPAIHHHGCDAPAVLKRLPTPNETAFDLFQAWQAKWPAEGVVHMTRSPAESLMRMIAAALQAERDRAIEECASAARLVYLPQCDRRRIVRAIRALKGKP